jgi:hypothetical protein
MSEEFNLEEAQKALEPGKNTIKGCGVIRQSGGV